jgi:hypothetical protein
MSTVTARMKCNYRDGSRVVLNPVYDPDPDSPNYSYSLATPSGSLELWISNSHALQAFVVDAEYEIIITRRKDE